MSLFGGMFGSAKIDKDELSDEEVASIPPEKEYVIVRKNNTYYVRDPETDIEINITEVLRRMKVPELVECLPLQFLMSVMDDTAKQSIKIRVQSAADAGDGNAQSFMAKLRAEDSQSPKYKAAKMSSSKSVDFETTDESGDDDEVVLMKAPSGYSPGFPKSAMKSVSKEKRRPQRTSSLKREGVRVVIKPSLVDCVKNLVTKKMQDDYEKLQKCVTHDALGKINSKDILAGNTHNGIRDVRSFEEDMAIQYTTRKTPGRFVIFAKVIHKYVSNHNLKHKGFTEEELNVVQSIITKYYELAKTKHNLVCPEIHLEANPFQKNGNPTYQEY